MIKTFFDNKSKSVFHRCLIIITTNEIKMSLPKGGRFVMIFQLILNDTASLIFSTVL